MNDEPVSGALALLDLRTLPLDRSGTRIHYEGSIDKAGRNADYDWCLFEDDRHPGEYVLFDAQGPGCILNFTQHRYPTSREPTFRFYFDGEDAPRFEIRHSEFGEKAPFVEPLATRYVGPVDHGRGPIRVVRSFVPMPFARGCRVTSDVALEGFDKAKGGGGWGHVVWQSFPDGGIGTFDPLADTAALERLWKKSGDTDVIPFREGGTASRPVSLAPGETAAVFEDAGAGLVSGISLLCSGDSASRLGGVEIRIAWNGAAEPQVRCPLDCFFGNELGLHSVRTLLAGRSTDGRCYNNFPMPYDSGCRIELANLGDAPFEAREFSVRHTREYNDWYAARPHHVFRTSEYCARKRTPGADSIIADICGSGHLAAALVTAYGVDSGYASCEGNVRVHIDGMRTPSVESDGSESYASYGWGFTTPPESNPASCYDGSERLDKWCELRLCMADPYWFGSRLRFGIESGEYNNVPMEHSGIVFWYGEEKTRLIPVDIVAHEIQGGAETRVDSVFESDDDDKPAEFRGTIGAVHTLRLAVPDGVGTVVLRRVSDQTEGRQRAEVFVCGERVEEYDWYAPDRNPVRRLLEDEFVLPRRYTEGRRELEIRIVPAGNSKFCVLELKALGYKDAAP